MAPNGSGHERGRPARTDEQEKFVLKKAGIVAAMVVGGTLVLTPLASAQEAAPAQVSNNCPIVQSGGTYTNSPGVIVNAPVAAGNCVGISLSNLINVNSGNTTVTQTRTVIRNSFNWRFLFRP
jgi:hypothetical protein